MQFHHDTTIVVTDGRTLRVLRNAGTELQPKLVELPRPDVHGDEESAPRHQHTGGDNADRRQLQDRRLDKDHQEASYALAVAQWLNHQVLHGAIESLVVVAPPRALGALRLHYSDSLKARLRGELAKEHTHDTTEQLEHALAAR